MKNKIILKKNDITDILGQEYKNLSDVISDKFGVINAIMERHELDEYGLKMFQCLSADTRILFNLKRDVSSGGLGISKNKQEALVGCIAEAIERYCMSYIPKAELYKECWDKLDKEHKVKNFHLYSEKQYSDYTNFLNPMKDKILWTKMYNLNEDKYIYWPASLVYLPFEIDKPVAELTSTGMAAGTSIEMSIQSGLLELIERDSLMINFKQRLNPPEIDLNTIENKEVKQLIGQRRGMGISSSTPLYVVELNKEKNQLIVGKEEELYTDLKVPTYLSYIWNKRGKEIHYGIGAATNLDSDISIYKSLKECLFTNFYSKNIMDLRKDNFDKINTLYEHFLYYQGSNFKDLLFDSKTIKYKHEVFSFDEIVEDLENRRNQYLL